MSLTCFSRKQMRALCWWCDNSAVKDRCALICDGAVRSGKTLCMGLSFVLWAFYRHDRQNFALCGRTIRSVKRNVVAGLLPLLRSAGFAVSYRQTENMMELSLGGRTNRVYLFGGKDSGSASLIQGMTLAGVLFDEAALMQRSFVEQALARCSAEGAKFWFNCNPENPQHWFYKEWIQNAEEKQALYLHFTMEDNPSLSAEVKQRYRGLFSGAFYERFIEGRWTSVEGLVYPYAEMAYTGMPAGRFESYAVSCDYGIRNPASFGLWGRLDGVWYRTDEYYYTSKDGGQRTDEEHYRALEELCGGKWVEIIVVDPSAASFIATIRRHGRFPVEPAKNDVLDGIRQVGNAIKTGGIRICRTCRDTLREFTLYRWKDGGGSEVPVKENDHAMDDIRYFVATVLTGETGLFACAVAR